MSATTGSSASDRYWPDSGLSSDDWRSRPPVTGRLSPPWPTTLVAFGLHLFWPSLGRQTATRRGLAGDPQVHILASVERHVTIDRALRFLGLDAANVEQVSADGQGAIRVDEIQRALDARPAEPTIVCLQVGNLRSEACDDVATAAAIAHEHGAWVHVDGAFGLWAAANPRTRPLTAGIETADSWAVDGHKWLNVPHHSGYVFCAHPHSRGDDPYGCVSDRARPRRLTIARSLRTESSRRARGVRYMGGAAPVRHEWCGRVGRAMLLPRPRISVSNWSTTNRRR